MDLASRVGLRWRLDGRFDRMELASPWSTRGFGKNDFLVAWADRLARSRVTDVRGGSFPRGWWRGGRGRGLGAALFATTRIQQPLQVIDEGPPMDIGEVTSPFA